MAKYPISKEFFPFNMFAPPMSRSFVLLAQKGMAGGSVPPDVRAADMGRAWRALA